MGDTTVKKVESRSSPRGSMGQAYLASGKHVSMRLWEESPGDDDKAATCRDYEVVGFLIEGEAELELEGQRIHLRAGDSWLVPPHAEHAYRVLQPLKAVEACSPPAHVDDRDAAPRS